MIRIHSWKGNNNDVVFSVYYRRAYFYLFLILALLGILVKDIAKVIPATLGNKNRVAEVAFNLADCDVTTLGVLFARKEEVLVLDTYMARLRGLSGSLSFAVVIFLNQLFQVIVEFFHAISRNENLESGVSARKRLRYLKEATPSVFLQIKTMRINSNKDQFYQRH